jgi:hypothetical protein
MPRQDPGEDDALLKWPRAQAEVSVGKPTDSGSGDSAYPNAYKRTRLERYTGMICIPRSRACAPYLSTGARNPSLVGLGTSVFYAPRGTICILRSRGFYAVSGPQEARRPPVSRSRMTWRGGGAHRSWPQGIRRVAAARQGGSGGAVPVRSPAWTINCQRARGRGAARRDRRASFPRPPPIRRGLCRFQRALRAAFPAPRVP